MIDLSIVITSFNTKDLLLGCINSITKYTKDIIYELIVVDNGSNDESVKTIEKLKAENIKVIKNKENLGFAKANNQGIEKARGRYILLLNSDTKLVENSLSKMVDWMDKHKDVGISSCMLINPDGSIQATGGSFPSIFKVFLWSTFLDDLPFIADIFGSYHPHAQNFLAKSNYYKSEHQQDWITGAFFFIRREAIEKTGLLDESFFMYVEELELCFRVKKFGWKIYYTTVAKIIHIGGGSGSTANSIIREFNNLKLFYKKHKSFLSQIILRILLKWAALSRLVMFGTLKSKKNAREAYAEAFFNS